MTVALGRTEEPLVRVSGLGVRRGHRDVLRDINLEVNAGEIVAVLGPNGAGKSTLLEVIGSVLEPTAGEIQRNARVATAMQSPDLARRTARANVELALAWWGVPRAERRARALSAMTQIRADHLADRPVASLSGGERRRVHLARALALRPDVLLLDEPFAGLDDATKASLLDDASAAIRSSARAVVVVVHDRGEAWALADRLVVLLDGQLAADGVPRQVLECPPTAQVARFLGFGGELVDGDEIVLTRPSHVQLDPTGDVSGTVTRLTPLEDGARAEILTEGGRLHVVVPLSGPRVGDQVRVRVCGGVRFGRDE
jgi:ABC-type nitrate/sulfonate/bicarbonate transport system ATPase subunit